MQRAKRRSLLSEHISDILRGKGAAVTHSRGARSVASRTLISGSMALLVMTPVQVDAVGLGELQVQSPLGRPLQAIVPMRTGQGESLPANCVKPRKTQGELTQPRDLRVTSPVVSGPGTYEVRISTPGSLYEPMYELSLVINCPGTPVLVRQYVFMLDLPGTFSAASAAEQSPVTGLPESTTTPRTNQDRYFVTNPGRAAATPDPSRALDKSAAPIDAGTLYRVRRGDTLSTIAARIEGRLPNATWALAGHLFATNADAFIGNDPNLIKLGSLIRIPEAAQLRTITANANNASSRPGPGLSDPTPLPESAPAVDAATLAAPRVDFNEVEIEFVQDQGQRPVYQSEVATAKTGDDAAQQHAPAEASGELSTDSEIWNVDNDRPKDPMGGRETHTESPFLDEKTAGATVDSVPRPQVVPTPAAAASTEGRINPWLAIGLGLLLALGLGALMLRRRFQTLVVNLWPSRDLLSALFARIMKPKSAHQPGFGDAGHPDLNSATAAFRTSVEDGDDVKPLPIGNPMEQTYIVESLAEASTEQLVANPPESAELPSQPADSPSDLAQSRSDAQVGGATNIGELPAADKSDEDLLAEIFAEASNDIQSATESETFEPTSKLPKVSGLTEDEIFDPTGELPEQLVDVVIDPTADMPLDTITAEDSSLMQAFTEKLEEVDPQMFEAAVPIDDTMQTGQSERITSPADEEVSLGALPKASDEDDELSETLYDALTLLEHDYEDEFTASQILERTAIKESLATMEAEEEQKGDDDVSDDQEKVG